MKIILPSYILKKFKCHMQKAGRREIGGMLMGEDLGLQAFRVVDYSVDMKSGTSSSFRRNSAQHELSLQKFYKETGYDYRRFNYLGEWHTHPSFSVEPSKRDMNSMQDIVECDPNIDFAFMLIIRLRWIYALECSSYLFIRGQSPVKTEVVYET